jgi:hypothetical protein
LCPETSDRLGDRDQETSDRLGDRDEEIESV